MSKSVSIKSIERFLANRTPIVLFPALGMPMRMMFFRRKESAIESFDAFGSRLDEVPDFELDALEEHFMSHKCGLIDPGNPCRRRRKIKGLIQAGLIDRNNHQFNNYFIDRISAIAPGRSKKFVEWKDGKYGALFKDHPYYDKDKSGEFVSQLVRDNDFHEIFTLNHFSL